MAKLNIKRLWNRSAGRVLFKITSDFKDWATLPGTIRNKRVQAESQFPMLKDSLLLYRAFLITCNYIASNIDRDIWASYKWLNNEMKELVSFEENYYLRFCSLNKLHSINNRWDIFNTRQEELQKDLEYAPSAVSFYNKMASSKEKHEQDKKENMEISQKLSKAYTVLENAMNYIEQYNQEHSISAFGASVLSIDKARELWGQKLEEIRGLENNEKDLNRVVEEVEDLAKIIFDAPALGKWVNEIEDRYNHLVYDHNLLINSYGKVVIPSEIQEETKSIINEMIPKLWMQGKKDELTQSLAEVGNFLDTYEPEVEREIAFAERHALQKQTRTSDQDQGLTHLVEFTRIFMAAMDIRDPLMSTHSLTVTRLAVATAKIMNWDQEEIQYLEIAALLHDVGKLWVPESILTKKNKLTEQDIKMIRLHPVYGAQILKSSGLFELISPWIYHHQELWNGTGYPDGLKEDAIPIQSRIISICEAFAAMLTGSPSRTRLSIEDAIERIKYEAGTFFDPYIVPSFITAAETLEMDYLVKFVENK